MADLISLCSRNPGRANPTDKIVKNLCTFLCSDTAQTPVLEDNPSHSGILSIQKDSNNTSNNSNSGKGGNNAAKDKEASTAAMGPTAEQKQAQLMKRGAEITLRVLCDRFGGSVFNTVPKLWECMAIKLNQVFGQDLPGTGVPLADAAIQSDLALGQEVIDTLTIMTTVAPYLSSDLWPNVNYCCFILEEITFFKQKVIY